MQSGNRELAIAHFSERNGIHTVEEHLLETADLASRHAAKIGLSALGELEGLSHDLIKFGPDFQAYIRSSTGLIKPGDPGYLDPENVIDHSTGGALYVWRRILGGEPTELDEYLASILAVGIASHHGQGMSDCLSSNGRPVFLQRLEDKLDPEKYEEAIRAANPDILRRIDELVDSGICHRQLLDVIGKMKALNLSRTERDVYLGFIARFLWSCLIDADRTSTADFENNVAAGMRSNGDYPAWEVLCRRIEDKIAGFKCDSLFNRCRRDLSNACLDASSREPGAYLLTAPTSCGKHFASLRFSLHHGCRHDMDRCIYVTAYTSVIDQNATAAAEVLGKKTVLECHSNLIPEKYTWKNSVLSENWDARIVYSTMVQFLEAFFGASSRCARRMHQMARSVLTFDEIQTLPVRYIHMFNNACNFLVALCGSTVTLSTATMPLLHRGLDKKKGMFRIANRESAEMGGDIKRLFELMGRKKAVYYPNPCDWRPDVAGQWSPERIAQLAVSEDEKFGSCLVVVNRKQDAKQTYLHCKRLCGHKHVYHLSTNMCPKHRRRVRGAVEKRLEAGKRVVCVSTQLIEAGIDIDFGAVVRHLAGLDSIAQAAGRCDREGRRSVSRITIVQPENWRENLKHLPDILKGAEEAERILGEYARDPESMDGDILGLRAVERYYEYYFYGQAQEMDYPVSASAKNKLPDDVRLLELISSNGTAFRRCSRKPSPLRLNQSFRTAGKLSRPIDAPTEGVIAVYDEAAQKIIEKLFVSDTPKATAALLKRAQEYSVSLSRYDYEKLLDKGVLGTTRKELQCKETSWALDVAFLPSEYYSSEYGFVGREEISKKDL